MLALCHPSSRRAGGVVSAGMLKEGVGIVGVIGCLKGAAFVEAC